MTKKKTPELTYEAITAETESFVKTLMSAPPGVLSPADRKIVKHWAKGAVMLWARMTHNQENAADKTRLEAMLRKRV